MKGGDILNQLILFVCCAFPSCLDEPGVDKASATQLRDKFVSRDYVGPEAYKVVSRTEPNVRGRESSEVNVTVARDGDMLRLSRVTESGARSGESVLLLNANGLYRLGRHEDYNYYSVQRISGPDLTEVINGGGDALYGWCASALPDWVATLVVGPAIRGDKGFRLNALSHVASGYSAIASVPDEVAALFVPPGSDSQNIEFQVDESGNLASWCWLGLGAQKGIREEQHVRRLDGRFAGMEYHVFKDGKRVGTVFSDVVDYSRRPIDPKVFELESFGLSEENSRWPVLIVIVVFSAFVSLAVAKFRGWW